MFKFEYSLQFDFWILKFPPQAAATAKYAPLTPLVSVGVATHATSPWRNAVIPHACLCSTSAAPYKVSGVDASAPVTVSVAPFAARLPPRAAPVPCAYNALRMFYRVCPSGIPRTSPPTVLIRLLYNPYRAGTSSSNVTTGWNVNPS